MGGERRWLTFSVFIECESWKVYVVVVAAGEAEDAEEYQQNVGESFCVHDGTFDKGWILKVSIKNRESEIEA